ncbi:MAG: hypothetical protein AB1530_06315 [Candidatus Omnitrophota bacterium]
MEKKRSLGLLVVGILIIVSNLIALSLLIKIDIIFQLSDNNFLLALPHPFMTTFFAGFPMLGSGVFILRNITIGLHTLLLILGTMILFLNNLARKLFIILEVMLLLLGVVLTWFAWDSTSPNFADTWVFIGGVLIPAGYIFYFTRPHVKEQFK